MADAVKGPVEPPPRPPIYFTRRQIQSSEAANLRLRPAGNRQAPTHAEGARPAQWACHGRVYLGLSRLATRRPRPEFLARQASARCRRHFISAGPQRGSCSDRHMGVATGRDARRGQAGRRLLRSGTARVLASIAAAMSCAMPISRAPRNTAACLPSWAMITPPNRRQLRINPSSTSSM